MIIKIIKTFVVVKSRRRTRAVVCLAVIILLGYFAVSTFVGNMNYRPSRKIGDVADIEIFEDIEPVDFIKSIKQPDPQVMSGVVLGSQECVIAVASSVYLLRTLTLAALNTWVPQIENLCDVRVFVGRGNICPILAKRYGDRLLQLDVADAYPPVEKVCVEFIPAIHRF